MVEVQEKRIGMTHGSDGPCGIDERVKTVFDGDQVDVTVYGHAHRAQNEVIDGVLFFNPGTAAEFFGILAVEDGVVKGEIVRSS